MRELLILVMLLAVAPAVACDCEPDDGAQRSVRDGFYDARFIQEPLNRARKRADDATTCERARVLGELQNTTSTRSASYRPVRMEYEHWLKRCERFLESETDRAWPSGGGE